MALALARTRAYRCLKAVPWLARAAMAVIVLYGVVVALAPLLAPHGETEIVGNAYEPSSSAFLLGTDNLGRDMLSRLIHGARNTIGIALLTCVLSCLVGMAAGFAAAVSGEWLDQLLSRVVDVLIAIPKLIFS